MQKLVNLREHLLSLDHLEIEPEKLATFVSKGGKLISFESSDYAGNKNFQINYTATVVVYECKVSMGVLGHELTQWLNENELNKAEDSIKFIADIYSHDNTDIEFEIPLTETVFVEVTEQGTKISNVNRQRQDL